MLKRLLLNTLFILLWYTVSAQSYSFKHITTDNGLPTNYIQCILQDKQGFIWFGTQEGLCKYDGYNITIYKNNTDKNSLASSDITCLYEHSNGKIYIGTRNAGLTIFDPVKNSFERVPTSGTAEQTLTHLKVTGIIRENADHIWIATANGVNLFNTVSKRVDQFLFPVKEEVTVACLYKYNDILFIGTGEKGIWQLDKEAKLREVRLVENENYKADYNLVRSVTKISEYAGSLYLATQGEGLAMMNPKTFEIEKIKNFTSKDEDIKYILSFEIKDNKIYVCSKQGFVVYDLLSDKYAVIAKEEEKRGLNDNHVTCIYIDNNDNLWLGSFTGGVNVSFIQNQKFPNLQKEISQLFLQTYSIYEDDEHELWVGGEKFLRVLNRKNISVRNFDNIVGLSYILAITGDSKKNIWLGTWGQSLIKYNRTTKKTEKVLVTETGNLSVLTIQIDAGDNLWLGTFNDGLFYYDTKTNKAINYGEKDGLSSNNITSFFKDTEGNIWLGTDGGGACLIPGGNFSNKNAILSFLQNDSINSICSNTVYGIYQDKNKCLWFATAKGLSKYDTKSKTFTNFREEDGLANNFVLSILPDSTGNLWMSTNKGITRFDPNIENKNGSAFRNYDQKDGLLNNEYVQGAFGKCMNGELVFGSTNGINIFKPEKIIDNAKVPPVYLVSFKRGGKDVLLDSAITQKKFIQCSWRENFFQFEVAALDYNDPSKNKYMYMLEGYDKDWSEPTTVRYVSYTELSGGDYTFKVKAANNDGVWNETPFEIHIKVIPPFWKTVWFYIVVSVLGLVGIVLFTQYRTKAIKKENKILEQKVAERTRELAEKNRDITSSIEYAKRIQEAILPAKDFIFSKLPNSFILYKPKDIVSGDFYWFGAKNDCKIIAVVDCTGHGVPGAFMSMIGHNLLNQIVMEKGLTDPGDILNNLHTGVQDALKQGRNAINTNDGMDVSLLCINEKTHETKWAGAFRSLVIVRAIGIVEKIDGNKFPVGGAQLDTARTFITKTIKFQPDDTAYMFSDGYADQFGGDKGKKFMVKHFHDLLSTIYQKDLNEQKTILEHSFEQWRGSHEQVDDVLVVGVRF